MHEMCVTYGHCGGRKHITHLLPSVGEITADRFATLALEADEISQETSPKDYDEQHRLISNLFKQHLRSASIDASVISEL